MQTRAVMVSMILISHPNGGISAAQRVLRNERLVKGVVVSSWS